MFVLKNGELLLIPLPLASVHYVTCYAVPSFRLAYRHFPRILPYQAFSNDGAIWLPA